MAHDVFEKLREAGKLPTAMGVALEVLRLADREDVSTPELAEVVEKDPALSGQLLSVVNSAFAGVPRKIASVSRASAMLADVLVHRDASKTELSSILRAGLVVKLDPGMMQSIFDGIVASWQATCAIFHLETRNVLTLGEIYARAAEKRRAISVPPPGSPPPGPV
jgi:hypothetical protein